MKVSIQILPNAKGGYTGVCLTLPGCFIRAGSRELVRKKLEEAIEGYLAALGEFVPQNLRRDIVEV